MSKTMFPAAITVYFLPSARSLIENGTLNGFPVIEDSAGMGFLKLTTAATGRVITSEMLPHMHLAVFEFTLPALKCRAKPGSYYLAIGSDARGTVEAVGSDRHFTLQSKSIKDIAELAGSMIQGTAKQQPA